MRRTQESYLPTTKYLHWIHSLGTLIAGMIGGGIVTRGKFTAATAARGFEKKTLILMITQSCLRTILDNPVYVIWTHARSYVHPQILVTYVITICSY